MSQQQDSKDRAGNPFVQPQPPSQAAFAPTSASGTGRPAASTGQPQPPIGHAAFVRGEPAGASDGSSRRQPEPQAAVPVAYLSAPQRKSHGWIVALVAVVCLFAFGALCVGSCSSVLSGAVPFAETGAPAGDSVAIIDVGGTIQYDGTACSPEGLKSLLDQAEADEGVKAVVLRVNSGGGTATAGEEMATYVRDFGKPIVVSSASLNASAAYEISSQADYIFVAKSTEIGSIGTAIEITDLSGLLDMLGVDVDVIASSDSKDSSYGYRPLTDEERAYYQHMVDQINDIFVENVAQGRGMTVEEVRKLATGLVYTGLDAIDNGLADEVGTLEDALDKAAELAGISDYSPYDLDFGRSYDLSELYYLLGGQSDSSTPGALLSFRI